MMLALTALNTFSKSTARSLSTHTLPGAIPGIPLTAEDDSITELYRFLLLRPPLRATGEDLGISPERHVGKLLSDVLEPHLSTVAIVPSHETATDPVPPAASENLQELFRRAEAQLSGALESTARNASNLLRRLRALIGDISTRNITGRLVALVDRQDGSTRIEWIRNGSRLGFVLDRERESSSWFVVLPNGLSKSGYLYGEGQESLRELLEEFVAAEE